MRGTGISETKDDIYAYGEGAKILVHTTNLYNDQNISFGNNDYVVIRNKDQDDENFYHNFVNSLDDESALHILQEYNQLFFKKTLAHLEQYHDERKKLNYKTITFDYVHTPTTRFLFDASNLLAQHLNIPLISTIHVNEKELQKIDTFKLPHSNIILQKDKETKIKSDFVICKNKAIMEDTIKYNKSTCIVNNSLSLPNIKNSALRKKDIKKILYVGRLSFEKGLDRLITIIEEITKKHDNYTFYICGRTLGFDPKIDKLIEYLNNNNQVKMMGYLSEGKLAKMYLQCGLVIVPSRTEAYCHVIMEALYYGCYVIATNVGANVEQIGSSMNGYIVNNNKEEKNIVKNFIKKITTLKSIKYDKIHTFGKRFNNHNSATKKIEEINNFLYSFHKND